MKVAIALLCLAAASCASTPGGRPIAILSAGAVEPGLRDALALFDTDTRVRTVVSFNTAPQIRERITKSEKFDMVIVPPAMMDAFAREGRISGERVALGSVGQGLAVRADAPLPEVSSVDAMKQALLAADRVVFNRATGGQYIESMLKKIGVYDEIARKTVRYDSAAQVMEHLAKGAGREIGFGPITEIRMQANQGVRLVAPLPAEVQQRNAYVASTLRDAANPKGAASLLRFMATPAAKAALAAGGVEP
jgi:molybdate transport system substrate-binding protein